MTCHNHWFSVTLEIETFKVERDNYAISDIAFDYGIDFGSMWR